MDQNENKAFVHEVDGKLVLEDPAALGMIKDVNKSNCQLVYDANVERIEHFKQRVFEKGLETKDVVMLF